MVTVGTTPSSAADTDAATTNTNTKVVSQKKTGLAALGLMTLVLATVAVAEKIHMMISSPGRWGVQRLFQLGP